MRSIGEEADKSSLGKLVRPQLDLAEKKRFLKGHLSKLLSEQGHSAIYMRSDSSKATLMPCQGLSLQSLAQGHRYGLHFGRKLSRAFL